jgi:N-acetylneuraminic acid mutarotase
MKNSKFVFLFVMFLICSSPQMSFADTLTPVPIQSLNVPHNMAGVEVYDGKIYTWSGYTSTTPPGAGRTTTHEMYNPATNTWSTNPPAPVRGARNGMGNFGLNGKFYSVGGEQTPSGSFTNAVYRYDVGSNLWNTMNPFPTTLWQPLNAACNGTGYIIGGRHGYGQTYSDVYAYNQTNDSWVPRASMLYSTMQAGTVTYGDKIYVFGGAHKASESSWEWTKRIQVYDTVQNSWSYENVDADVPVILSASQAVVYDHSAWLFARNVYSDSSGTVTTPNEYAYEYDFLTKTWATHQFIPSFNIDYGTELALVGNNVYFTSIYDSPGNPVFLTDAYSVAIPEPATILLLSLGGLFLRRGK